MREIGTTKIGKQMPKPGFTYPTIRLPQDHTDIIGETVTLFETSHEGKRAFLIVTDKMCAQPVIQPEEIVAHSEFEKRIIELEKRIGFIDEGRTNSAAYPAPFIKTGQDSPPPCKGDVITN